MADFLRPVQELYLAVVVAITFALQVWSHHSDILERFLMTSPLPVLDCLLLPAVGTIPLVVLEGVKLVKSSRDCRLAF